MPSPFVRSAREGVASAWRWLWEELHAVLLGAVSGGLAGVGVAAFLRSLDWATRTRLAHGWLLWLLPLMGLLIGLVYHYGAGRAAGGNNLIIEEIHEPDAHLPRRLPVLIYAASVATHLVGGSSGREGVAIQMSAGLSDLVSRLFGWRPAERRGLLVIAIAAGFGAVFGTPVAGAVFALEVPTVGRFRTDLLLPALTAALTGDIVTGALGVHHDARIVFAPMTVNLANLARAAVLGVVCGLVALGFVVAVHGVKRLAARALHWPPLRPVAGGIVLLAMVGISGTRDYLGLSLPLGRLAQAGVTVGASVFAWKLVFTAVTLGSGFQGGEVTPLFVMGATVAAAIAPTLGLPVASGAALGYVAVFGAAANTPLTCAVLAAELFGGSVLPFAAVTCLVATLCSTRRSIYVSQRPAAPR